MIGSFGLSLVLDCLISWFDPTGPVSNPGGIARWRSSTVCFRSRSRGTVPGSIQILSRVKYDLVAGPVRIQHGGALGGWCCSTARGPW